MMLCMMSFCTAETQMKSEMMLRSRLATDSNSMLANPSAVNLMSAAVLDSVSVTGSVLVAGLMSVTGSDLAGSDSVGLLSAPQVSAGLILMMEAGRTAAVMISDGPTEADEDAEDEMGVRGS